MKTIAQWVEVLMDRSAFTGIPYDLIVRDIRKDALEEAERIARRDDHTETADKIAALKNVP